MRNSLATTITTGHQPPTFRVARRSSATTKTVYMRNWNESHVSQIATLASNTCRCFIQLYTSICININLQMHRKKHHNSILRAMLRVEITMQTNRLTWDTERTPFLRVTETCTGIATIYSKSWHKSFEVAGHLSIPASSTKEQGGGLPKIKA